MKRTKMQRALATGGTLAAILALSDDCGLQIHLSSTKKLMKGRGFREYARNGTLLSRSCLFDVTELLVQTFSSSRRSRIGFKDGRLGKP